MLSPNIYLSHLFYLMLSLKVSGLKGSRLILRFLQRLANVVSFTGLSLPPHHLPGELSPRRVGVDSRITVYIYLVFSVFFSSNSVDFKAFLNGLSAFLKKKNFYEKILQVTLHIYYTLMP